MARDFARRLAHLLERRGRAARFLVDPGIWTFGAWGMEHLEDYRLILDYRKRRLLIHTPHADEQPSAPGIVSIEHAEPELASRIGLR